MFGFHYFRDDGSPASAWDLFSDRKLFDRQRRSAFESWEHYCVTPFPAAHPRSRELNLAYRHARYRDCYFNPREAVAIGNHFVGDYEKFLYPWRCQGADPAREAVARQRLAQLTRELGWPDWVWDFKLFDEALPTRD